VERRRGRLQAREKTERSGRRDGERRAGMADIAGPVRSNWRGCLVESIKSRAGRRPYGRLDG
jgi:hypothetical protein